MRNRHFRSIVFIVMFSVVFCSCSVESEAKLYAQDFIDAALTGDPLEVEDYVDFTSDYSESLYWTSLYGSSFRYELKEVDRKGREENKIIYEYTIGVPQKGFAVSGDLIIERTDDGKDSYRARDYREFFDKLIACGIIYDYCDGALDSKTVSDESVKAYIDGILNRMINRDTSIENSGYKGYLQNRSYALPFTDTSYSFGSITYSGSDENKRIDVVVTLKNVYIHKEITISLVKMDLFDGNYGIVDVDVMLSDFRWFNEASGVAAIDGEYYSDREKVINGIDFDF